MNSIGLSATHIAATQVWSGSRCGRARIVAFVGESGIGDIDEQFDRWFVNQLEQAELGNLLDKPNDELMEAGNGTGELGAWVAVAGSMRGRPLLRVDGRRDV
jgi:hypothetical protein